jgi:hypothetical protein
MIQDDKITFSVSDLKPSQINEAALTKVEGFDYWQLLLPTAAVLGLVVLASLAVVFYRRWRQSQKLQEDPKLLFREICDAYSLSWSQRRSLLKLVSLNKISNPALVMLDSGLWSQGGSHAASRSLSNRLSQLHRMLFEEIPAPKPDANLPKVDA